MKNGLEQSAEDPSLAISTVYAVNINTNGRFFDLNQQWHCPQELLIGKLLLHNKYLICEYIFITQ